MTAPPLRSPRARTHSQPSLLRLGAWAPASTTAPASVAACAVEPGSAVAGGRGSVSRERVAEGMMRARSRPRLRVRRRLRAATCHERHTRSPTLRRMRSNSCAATRPSTTSTRHTTRTRNMRVSASNEQPAKPVVAAAAAAAPHAPAPRPGPACLLGRGCSSCPTASRCEHSAQAPPHCRHHPWLVLLSLPLTAVAGRDGARVAMVEARHPARLEVAQDAQRRHGCRCARLRSYCQSDPYHH